MGDIKRYYQCSLCGQEDKSYGAEDKTGEECLICHGGVLIPVYSEGCKD